MHRYRSGLQLPTPQDAEADLEIFLVHRGLHEFDEGGGAAPADGGARVAGLQHRTQVVQCEAAHVRSPDADELVGLNARLPAAKRPAELVAHHVEQHGGAHKLDVECALHLGQPGHVEAEVREPERLQDRALGVGARVAERAVEGDAHEQPRARHRTLHVRRSNEWIDEREMARVLLLQRPSTCSRRSLDTIEAEPGFWLKKICTKLFSLCTVHCASTMASLAGE